MPRAQPLPVSYEPESGLETLLAVDLAGTQTQQDGRFRRPRLPSVVQWHRPQAVVTRDPHLAAYGRETFVRVDQPPDAAGDAGAAFLVLGGLRVGKLVRVLDEAAVGAAAAD